MSTSTSTVYPRPPNLSNSNHLAPAHRTSRFPLGFFANDYRAETERYRNGNRWATPRRWSTRRHEATIAVHRKSNGFFFLTQRESLSPAEEPCAGAKQRRKYIVMLLYHQQLLQEIRSGGGGRWKREYTRTSTTCPRGSRRYARRSTTPTEAHRKLGYLKEEGRGYSNRRTKILSLTSASLRGFQCQESQFLV
jgi:hypothetical protein